MKSKIKIKGKYTFTVKFNAPMYGTICLTTNPFNNKITAEGKELILRRLYGQVVDPIKYIIVSKGQDPETLKKSGICHETTQTTLKPPSVEFVAPFTNTEMENVEQIGLTNKGKDGDIITHSTLNTPFSKLPEGVTININYTLTLGE